MSREGEKRIIDEIEDSAKRRAEAIKKEALEESKRLEAENTSRVTLGKEAILGRGEQDAQMERTRILAEARIQAKRKKMAAQQEYMAMAFQRAEAGLQQFAYKKAKFRKEYRDVLADLIMEAALSVGRNSLEILVSERDRERVSPLLKSLLQKISRRLKRKISLSLSDETVNTMGGAVVKTTDGTLGVDNTFESRLQRMKESLRPEVARVLFED